MVINIHIVVDWICLNAKGIFFYLFILELLLLLRVQIHDSI